jgi:hypothetical protein
MFVVMFGALDWCGSGLFVRVFLFDHEYLR